MDETTPSPPPGTPEDTYYHVLAREFVAAMNADDETADESQHIHHFVEAWNHLVRKQFRPETIITMLATLVGTDDVDDVPLEELTEDVAYFLSRVSHESLEDAE